jgi:hypothetical protein
MNIAMHEAWKPRVVSVATWVAAITLCVFGLLSISRIGSSIGNLCILGVGMAQLLITKFRGRLGRQIAAVEMVLLALMSLPFYFAFRETSGEMQIPFWGRVALFVVGVIILVGLAGLCLSEAARLSSGRLRR